VKLCTRDVLFFFSILFLYSRSSTNMYMGVCTSHSELLTQYFEQIGFVVITTSQFGTGRAGSSAKPGLPNYHISFTEQNMG
jgi:hypothetical protein